MRIESGATKPIMVFYFTYDMQKDCCAANYERAVFMYKPIVDLVSKFKCIRTNTLSPELTKSYSIDKKKPALILLDAEGGLLSVVQKCQNPKTYLKQVKRSFALSGKRVKMRSKYVSMQKQVRSDMDRKDYGRALKTLEKMFKREQFLMGDIKTIIQKNHSEIKSAGEAMLQAAIKLETESNLMEAYRQYKQIKTDFVRISELSKSANERAKKLRSKLKDMGVSIF